MMDELNRELENSKLIDEVMRFKNEKNANGC